MAWLRFAVTPKSLTPEFLLRRRNQLWLSHDPLAVLLNRFESPLHAVTAEYEWVAPLRRSSNEDVVQLGVTVDYSGLRHR